jgi:hypothetical protein
MPSKPKTDHQNKKPDVPHEHPLWSDFQECVKRNIANPDSTMLEVYWRFYLAGAHKARHRMKSGENIGLVTSLEDRLTVEAGGAPQDDKPPECWTREGQ